MVIISHSTLMRLELHENGTCVRGLDDTFQSKTLRKTITDPAHASRQARGRFFRIPRNRKTAAVSGQIQVQCHIDFCKSFSPRSRLLRLYVRAHT